MQLFANKFSIAMNESKSEVVVNFFQNVPTIPGSVDGTTVSGTMDSEVVPISNLVMTGEFAEQLATTLLRMLEQKIPEVD